MLPPPLETHGKVEKLKRKKKEDKEKNIFLCAILCSLLLYHLYEPLSSQRFFTGYDK